MTEDGRRKRSIILISACLAGLRTRYDGIPKPHQFLSKLAASCVIVPVCPEILGGLGIPRSSCRFSGGDGKAVIAGRARIVDRTGVDRTEEFLKGAEETLNITRLVSPELIIFKEGSPSCGLRRVDIEGKRVEGCGVVTAFLAGSGIPMISDEDPLPF